MEVDTEPTDYYFVATMDSTKTLCSLLKAIQFQETAILSAMPEGLKLTVEEGKCVQATAYIPSENFSEYSVKSDVDVLFKISIAVLTECLNIYGTVEEPSVKMYYRSEGSPLLLILQPQSYTNIITDCEIQTQTADSVLELRDEDEDEVAKLVLKAPAVLGLLADVERSCDVLELVLSPDHPHLCIITEGMQDRSCIEVPKCSDMVQSFQCSRAVTLRYQLQHIRLIMKTLAISSRVVLRCSANGLLLLQLKIEKEEHKQISIAVLTECLNIYGTVEEPSVKMYYRSEGSPLLLILQPQSYTNIITDCEIQTQTADSVLELRDEDEDEVAKLVLKAPAVLGLLADVERSCDVLELVLSPDHPHLCIITEGMQDRSCIEVPKCSDMVQSFQCSRAVTLRYQLQHIRLIMKTLAISSRVVLRCSANGLLLLQLKIEKEEHKQVMYSEFYIVPLIDDI